MTGKNFDEWLSNLDLSFWGTAQHKITAAQFFEQYANEGAVLLDIRSSKEVEFINFPFSLHIPIDEFPERWGEVPRDKLVATFCSSASRAVVAWVYLQLHGLENVRILDAKYADIAAEMLPGKIYKRSRKQA